MKTFRKSLAVFFSVLFIFSCMTVMSSANDDDHYIKEAKIEIETPKAGKVPSFEVKSLEPDKYTAEIECWTDVGDYLGIDYQSYYPNGEGKFRFKYGHNCECRIIIHAVGEYEFLGGTESDNYRSSTDVTLNGNDLWVSYAEETPNTLYRQIYYMPEGNMFQKLFAAIRFFFTNLFRKPK